MRFPLFERTGTRLELGPIRSGLLATLFPGSGQPVALPEGGLGLVRSAIAHHVPGALCRVLADRAQLVALPTPARDALEAARDAQALQHALLQADLARLGDAVADAGVTVLLLKGTALWANRGFGPGDRHVSDIDLLVPPRALRPLAEALVARDFSPLRQVLRDGSSPDPLRLEPRNVRAAQPSFRGPHGIDLDLHVTLDVDESPFGRRFEDLVEGSRALPGSGPGLRAVGPWPLVWHLSEHVGTYHRFAPTLLLRHLLDVDLLWPLLAPELAAFRPRFRPGGPTAWNLSEVASLRRGMPASSDLRARLEPSRLRRAGMGAAFRLRRTRRLLTGREPRTTSLYRDLFPARAYVAARYGVAPTSPRLPLCYLDRALRFGLPFLPRGRPWLPGTHPSTDMASPSPRRT